MLLFPLSAYGPYLFSVFYWCWAAQRRHPRPTLPVSCRHTRSISFVTLWAMLYLYTAPSCYPLYVGPWRGLPFEKILMRRKINSTAKSRILFGRWKGVYCPQAYLISVDAFLSSTLSWNSLHVVLHVGYSVLAKWVNYNKRYIAHSSWSSVSVRNGSSTDLIAMFPHRILFSLSAY